MLKGKITVDSDVSGTLSNKEKLLNHEALYNRNAQNAHPIEAITGLLDFLEDLKRNSETLAANFYKHENGVNNAVIDETTRAQKVEASLALQMSQLSNKISSIRDTIKKEQTDFSATLDTEKIERIQVDEQLNKQLIVLDEKLENLASANNSHTKKSEKAIEEINLTLLNNEETFAQHLDDFNTHVSSLNKLILAFNNHLDNFESYLKNETEMENNTAEVIKELETRLNKEFSDRITDEKNQLTTDLNSLETSIVSELDTHKILASSELNKTKNDVLNYTDSQTEIVKTALEALDQKYVNEMFLLNEKIISEVELLEDLLRGFEETLNTINSDNQAEHQLLANRLDAFDILLNSYAETLREQTEQLSLRIEEVQNNLSNTDNDLQVFKDNSEIALNELDVRLSDKIEDLTSKETQDVANLNQKIQEEAAVREESLAEIIKDFKKADTETLGLANKHADNLAFQITSNYEEQDTKIIDSYKEADKNILLEAQKHANDLIIPLNNKITQVESWKSAIANVMDFVGITTTDITREYNKKNNTIKINDSYYSAVKGDVVLYNNKEYVWTGGEDESLGWEEIGIGSANEAAIAALQVTVGTRSDSENSSGIFKEIDDLKNSIESQLAEEITQTDRDVEAINENLTNLNTDIETRWIKPVSLIFNTKEEATDYLLSHADQVYPGQLFTIDTEGVLETYILDTSGSLQIFSSGGGSGGTPDKATDTQYCIQNKVETLKAPSTLEDFINNSEQFYYIEIPKPNRKNNTIVTFAVDAPGGYVYYASKLAGLKFTSAGFDAGFTRLGMIDDYNIYRSNQKLIDQVEITIN